MRDRLKNDKGFTMIEIIAVLIILAIVSAVVLVRGMSPDSAKLQAEVDTLKGHLRYAQCLAMNDVYPNKWGIGVQSSSYTLVKYVGNVLGTHTFSLPNESSATHTFATGVTALSATTVLFDDWGSPGTTSTSVSIDGQSITITAETGFIE